MPECRVINDAGSDHVQINIHNTANEVVTIFNNCRMITIFPKRTPAMFTLVELLAYSTGNELYRLGNNPLALIIMNQQMDMIGCHCVIQNYQPVPFLCLKKPLQQTMTIFDILEQKLSLVASMGDVPNMPWYVMPVCPCHCNVPISPISITKKTILPILKGCLMIFIMFIQLVILVRPLFLAQMIKFRH